MRAAIYERNGPAREVLRVLELPDPTPAAGEVLVRVHASGVNPSVVKKRAATPLQFPRIVPHSDGAGVIEAAGEGVSRARVGERVWLWNAQWNRAWGTAAELIALPQEQAVPLPAGLSFEQGATFGIPLQTALAALLPFDALAGAWVLVQGGTGAVGRFAIQAAKRLGARVIATAGSAAKAALSLAAGADHAVNYREEDVVAKVRALTAGSGVDRIVEVEFGQNAGADVEMLRASHGTIAVYGSANLKDARLEVRRLMFKNAAVRFLLVYDLSAPDRAAVLQAVAQLAPGLQTDVAERYPLQEIGPAHEAQESGRVVGNIVLLP